MARNIIVCAVINCHEVNAENVGTVVNYGKISQNVHVLWWSVLDRLCWLNKLSSVLRREPWRTDASELSSFEGQVLSIALRRDALYNKLNYSCSLIGSYIRSIIGQKYTMLTTSLSLFFVSLFSHFCQGPISYDHSKSTSNLVKRCFRLTMFS